MSNPLIKAVVATLIQVVLIFCHHSVQAKFSDTCDSTSSLSCIHTYEQLYHSLTKPDNSFNIGSALYPAKKPSSCRSTEPEEDRGFRLFRYFLAPLGVIYISFCSCWMLIGMMLNPIWGLTVAVTACLVIISFIFIVDSYGKVEYPRLKRMWANILVAVISLTLIVIFTGKPFNARETADEIFSAVLLTALVTATSLLTKRGWKMFTNPKARKGEIPVPSMIVEESRVQAHEYFFWFQTQYQIEHTIFRGIFPF